MEQELEQLEHQLKEIKGVFDFQHATVLAQQEQISFLQLQNTALMNPEQNDGKELTEKNFEKLLMDERKKTVEMRRNFRKIHEEAKRRDLSKTAAIQELQARIDQLNVLNSEIRQEQDQQKTELESIVSKFNEKLHEAIENEREQVKTVLDTCRLVVTQLNEKVNESHQKNLLLERQMREEMQQLKNFRNELKQQENQFVQWYNLLVQQKLVNGNTQTTSENSEQISNEAENRQESDQSELDLLLEDEEDDHFST